MVEKSHTAGGQEPSWWPQVYEPLRGLGQKIAGFFAPHAEASATDDFYEINLELPGVALENINVSVHDNHLTVQGEKRSHHEEKGKTYFFSERQFGAFQRSFRLPPGVETDRISADFKDGVLTLKVPKSGPPPTSARRIDVRSV